MHISYETRFPKKRWQRPLLFVLSLLIAVISGVLLLSNTSFGQLTSALISLGLDLSRAQLIATLMMTMGATLAGTALGGEAFGALIGSSLIFWSYYLYSFIQLELRPVYDPGGHLEPLASGTLIHTVVVMLALAFLSAFFGAASGIAIRRVLFNPPYRLIRLLRQPCPSRQSPTVQWDSPYQNTGASTARVIIHEVSGWVKAALLVIALLLAGQSAPLFLFSPDIGLHMQPRVITAGHTQPGVIENQKGTLLQDSLTSPAFNMQHRSFLVYVPPSYNTAAGKEKRYPVLYLLHGFPGEEHDWFTGGKASESANTLIDAEQIPEVILVAPDGNGRGGASSEWGNSYDQSQLMETFVAADLVKYVDQHYRTVPDPAHRAIGGLSMGGFGAMNIALHHPDVFGTVISLGGYYQAEGEIWGHNAAYMQKNSPVVVLAQDRPAWKLHIYLGAASQDQPYYNDTRQFMQELASLHISYQLDLQKGYHSWSVWQIQLYHALLWIKWG
jgi:enterochelin esterase-like enzyme